jgi:hypothetical protein
MMKATRELDAETEEENQRTQDMCECKAMKDA